MESAAACNRINTEPFYSTSFYICKGKLARREQAEAIQNGEDLEHILAPKKWPFVKGHFLVK
jgi:hypothetical protein